MNHRNKSSALPTIYLYKLSIYTNECFEFEFAVVRRARRDLATHKATTNTADHGVHGESILWSKIWAQVVSKLIRLERAIICLFK